MALTACLLSMVVAAATPTSSDWTDCKGSNIDAAIAGCTRILEGVPFGDADKVKALSYRGRALKRKQDYERAIRDFAECTSISATDKFCPTSIAEIDLFRTKYDEAVSKLDQVLAIDPDYTYALSIKGTALRMKGEYWSALGVLSKSLDLDPIDGYALYERGVTYNQLEQFDKAIADLSKALEIDRADDDSRSGRGCAYYYLGKFDLALKDLNRSVEGSPKDSYARAMRGTVRLERGDLTDALVDFDKAIELDSSIDWYFTARSLARIKAGKLDLALADLNHVLNKTPEAVEANAYLGMLRELKGDKEGAVIAFRKAIARPAGGPEDRKAQKFALDRLIELDPQ